MKVAYDKEVDAIYIQLSKLKPEGVVEVTDGINIDVTSDGKIVGIELLDATHKVSIDTLLTYEIAADSISEWLQTKEKDERHLT
ncbi:DUF2283 domain-containing protein [bacterium]|jgi:uncharacterized protein YuzE|nr:DUF2283 domain-containing protein [bacterium]